MKRGQELVLWSVLDAGNYNYLIEWSFRDDGSIAGRAGSTGPKQSGPNDKRGHMHVFTWRIDMDLNGPEGDSVSVERTANLTVTPSTGSEISKLVATERGLRWDAESFTVLKVFDATLQNGRGRQTSYQLQPIRTGTARHSEPHTAMDFWVTHSLLGSELLAKDVDLMSMARRQLTRTSCSGITARHITKTRCGMRTATRCQSSGQVLS